MENDSPAVGHYVVPTGGPRLNDRHDLLGPYNTADMAEWVAERHRDAAIPCAVVASVTRPVYTPECVATSAFRTSLPATEDNDPNHA